MPRFTYASTKKPIATVATKSEGPGWTAIIEGSHEVSNINEMKIGACNKTHLLIMDVFLNSVFMAAVDCLTLIYTFR